MRAVGAAARALGHAGRCGAADLGSHRAQPRNRGRLARARGSAGRLGLGDAGDAGRDRRAELGRHAHDPGRGVLPGAVHHARSSRPRSSRTCGFPTRARGQAGRTSSSSARSATSPPSASPSTSRSPTAPSTGPGSPSPGVGPMNLRAEAAEQALAGRALDDERDLGGGAARRRSGPAAYGRARHRGVQAQRGARVRRARAAQGGGGGAMNCPSCGRPLPEEAGQHAVVPSADIVDCPNCGARVSLETGRSVRRRVTRGPRGRSGRRADPRGAARLVRRRDDARRRDGRDRGQGAAVITEDRDRRRTSFKVTVNGEERSVDVEPRLLLVHFLRETARPDRHARRLRHVELRRLHGAGGRRPDQVVHVLRRPGERKDGDDRRGAGAGRASSIRSRRASRRSTDSSAGSARRG